VEIWKRNLAVCGFGMFVTSIGMSQIAPVLPLYIKELGVLDTASIERLSGIAFGATFIISAIFSPLWGRAADTFGRKPMLLRASLGMAIVVFAMGFAQNVYHLVGLRLLQGVITGYATACITLIAVQTPRGKAGWALGTLATASVAGSLFGPMLGGYLAEFVGLRSVFRVTGGLLMIAFVTTLLQVREKFVPSGATVPSLGAIWRQIPDSGLLITLFLTSLMTTVALYSIQPIITVYITQLTKNETHVALISGMTFAAAGLASVLVSSHLGKLSDRIGPQKVMLIALVAAGVLMVPQALVTNPWQLMVLRFLLGLATAGIMPALNTLVKHAVPDSITGRVFGINMSAQYLGVFSGSVLGGQVAALFGIRTVFFVTSALLLVNAAWVWKTGLRIAGRVQGGKEKE
jgi:MFS transporter, DHA1 family, multidrug resistance protein